MSPPPPPVVLAQARAGSWSPPHPATFGHLRQLRGSLDSLTRGLQSLQKRRGISLPLPLPQPPPQTPQKLLPSSMASEPSLPMSHWKGSCLARLRTSELCQGLEGQPTWQELAAAGTSWATPWLLPLQERGHQCPLILLWAPKPYSHPHPSRQRTSKALITQAPPPSGLSLLLVRDP